MTYTVRGILALLFALWALTFLTSCTELLAKPVANAVAKKHGRTVRVVCE